MVIPLNLAQALPFSVSTSFPLRSPTFRKSVLQSSRFRKLIFSTFSSSLHLHLLYIQIQNLVSSPPSSFYLFRRPPVETCTPYDNDNNILRLIKYQWSLPEEVLTPDTLFIPILILALKKDYQYWPLHWRKITPDTLFIPILILALKSTKMYSYICTLHITKYPGIYCTLVNYSLLPSTKYSTPYQE